MGVDKTIREEIEIGGNGIKTQRIKLQTTTLLFYEYPVSHTFCGRRKTTQTHILTA
jgi:hypothetical protein